MGLAKAYYNEIDLYAAEWLNNLILEGVIASGDVDTRSIEDVKPGDLAGYTQCHFFAGIGVWSYALRSAGWPDDRTVWTGSCPCQPFSAAGKRGGAADERHLWPAWSWIIRQCKPSVVFGEQVASKDGRNWLDLVQTDLEGMGFAVGAGDICAAGVGAPHIRQRLYFVADSAREQRNGSRNVGPRGWGEPANGSILGDSDDEGPQGHGRLVEQHVQEVGATERRHSAETGFDGFGFMADTDGRKPCDGDVQRSGEHGLVAQDGGAGGVGDTTGVGSCSGGSDSSAQSAEVLREGPDDRAAHFWSLCDWLPCIDGKARPVEPGTFPLAHGVAARVGRLRAYGNAIVAPCAEVFIRSYLDVRP